jgi:hypothetical protein
VSIASGRGGNDAAPARILLVAALWAALGTSGLAIAAEIVLPAGATDALHAIAAACPACERDGYLACGSPDVAWGRGFATHALLGRPPRAYLIASAMSGGEFRDLARTTTYPRLADSLHHRFAAARLVVLENDFTTARVLPSPSKVAVGFPDRLHTCVYKSEWPWACCVAGSCKEECCEKSLGSPTVVTEWKDGNETLTFHYSHTVGVSWLDRTTPEGRVRYACLTDAKGRLTLSP